MMWCVMWKRVGDVWEEKECPSPHTTAPLGNIKTSRPLELVCMDYLTLEESKGGYSNILVITDHFTHYTVAVPTRNQTAHTTAKSAVWPLPCPLRFPLPPSFRSGQKLRIRSDSTSLQTNRNREVRARHHTTPQGNGMCERMNRTILGMLGTLTDEHKADWKSYLAPLVHAYNCTRNDATGYSPYYLMYGRHSPPPRRSVPGPVFKSILKSNYLDL